MAVEALYSICKTTYLNLPVHRLLLRVTRCIDGHSTMSMRTPRQVLSQSSPPYSYDDSHYADVLSGSGRPHRRPENVDNDLDEFGKLMGFEKFITD